MIKQITVTELNAKLASGDPVILVDVREKDEHAHCRIPGATHIPLSEFAQRAPSELDRDAEIYIHCHHGGRSQKACEFLAAQGFERLANVAGGIDAWSLEIDPSVPRY